MSDLLVRAVAWQRKADEHRLTNTKRQLSSPPPNPRALKVRREREEAAAIEAEGAEDKSGSVSPKDSTHPRPQTTGSTPKKHHMTQCARVGSA